MQQVVLRNAELITQVIPSWDQYDNIQYSKGFGHSLIVSLYVTATLADLFDVKLRD